jgi:hypothetical protein
MKSTNASHERVTPPFRRRPEDGWGGSSGTDAVRILEFGDSS